MFEHKSAPLLPRSGFYWRLASACGVTILIVAASLAVGTVGYHYFGRLGWIDSLLNAAMILTGMGPVDPMTTTAGKLFAAFYALFSGVAFLTTIAVIAAPVVHRFMHRFHLDVEEE